MSPGTPERFCGAPLGTNGEIELHIVNYHSGSSTQVKYEWIGLKWFQLFSFDADHEVLGCSNHRVVSYTIANL